MLSPLDDRYFQKVRELHDYFSEDAMLKMKARIELDYYIALCEELNLPLNETHRHWISYIWNDIQPIHIKLYEEKTKHDIKAIEYYLRERFKNFDIPHDHMIHFGLTSQDINSLATSSMLKNFNDSLMPSYINDLMDSLNIFAHNNKGVFPARTHGQFAVPTLFEKEIRVFISRLESILSEINDCVFTAKFGGAVGNLSAHYIAYPEHRWRLFMSKFVNQYELCRDEITTQVSNNESISNYFDKIRMINNVLINFCRDMWMYSSYGYLNQKVTEEEIGSSTMPQKINPINFENAEGNLEFANCMLEFMSNKLQISRMQRDLTDTTVVRNIGVPLGHSVVAYKSILTGLERATTNRKKIDEDLEVHKSKLLAEAYQILLKKHNVKNGYELIKSVERDGTITIESLDISKEAKESISNLMLEDYIKHLKDHI